MILFFAVWRRNTLTTAIDKGERFIHDGPRLKETFCMAGRSRSVPLRVAGMNWLMERFQGYERGYIDM